jgi:cytochrome d ubiquinol oxidase subunit II
MNEVVLPTIWFCIIALEIGLFVILDGADLGIGLISLLPQTEDRRSLLIHSIGPVWDANETWLVIAGGTLFGAFPSAYAIILNALYIPAFIVIFGLILRAISFDFYSMSGRKRFWSTCFGLGSLLAVVGQGFAAGGLLSGIAVANGSFAGGPFDWLSLISLAMVIGVVASYGLVGYSYLTQRTGYELERETFARAVIFSGVAFVAFFITTLLLPETHALFLERWLTPPTSYLLLFFSAIIGILGLVLFNDIRIHRTDRLHTLCMSVFACSLIGLLIGSYPYLSPPSITIFNTAASETTLRFMLWGIGPLLPIVLAYNFYMHRIFRNEIAAEREEY